MSVNKTAFGKITLSFVCLTALLLSGCGFFADEKQKHLTGERISVLQLQNGLVPNEALKNTAVFLPAPQVNDSWPQSGGYASHAIGHPALQINLKEIWRESIGEGGNRRSPLISQPVAADKTVFTIDTEGQVTAFNLVTGKQKWRMSSVAPGTEEEGSLGGGLAYAAGKLYATNGRKQLVCINAVTGQMIWRAVISTPARAAPTVADERIYLITLDNRLMTFSAIDGSLLWDHAGVTETTNLLGSVSPAVDSSEVVLPMSSGEIISLRVENGQVAWVDNLSSVRRPGAFSIIADIRGQPVIDRGVVYAASYSGRMAAIDAVSGQRVWQHEIGSAEMPWVAGDGVFIISADQQLISLTRQGGDVRWIAQLSRFEEGDKEKPVVWTGPVLAGGRLVVASSKGMMMEISPQTGKVLRQTELPGEVTIPPLVVDNTLLLLTQSGKLVAYR